MEFIKHSNDRKVVFIIGLSSDGLDYFSFGWNLYLIFSKLGNKIDILSTIDMQIGNEIDLCIAIFIDILFLFEVDEEAGKVDVG